MPLLTEKPVSNLQEQTHIESWVASIRAPFVSRLMANPSFGRSNDSSSKSVARSKRRHEFAAGRRCAESLLKQLGCSQQVWTNNDRSPDWPTGFAGSISHSTNWTWAAVAKTSQLQSIGIDTEPVIPRDTRENILSEVTTPSEWSQCQSSGLNQDELFTLVFSAKEAFYKCCYPVVKQYFDFRHVCVEAIDPDRIRIRTDQSHPCFAQMPLALDVAYLVTQDHVFTTVWMEPTS